MYCPTCQTVVAASDELAAEQRCPICGGEIQPLKTDDTMVPTGNAVVKIESVPEQHWICGYLPANCDQKPPMAVILRHRKEDAVAVFERMAALPGLAWRQPAVRAVVKTGAGAIALSLAVRAARSWLAQPWKQEVGEKLLPALAETLRAPVQARRGRQDPVPDEGALVIETFIYARQVIRR